jgi:prevent-host-death family protein
MEKVNIHQAKTNLSRLIEEVSNGAEIVIAKAGKPVAKLVPLTAPKRVRKLGTLKGKIKIPDDFDAPLPAKVIASFEGR